MPSFSYHALSPFDLYLANVCYSRGSRQKPLHWLNSELRHKSFKSIPFIYLPHENGKWIQATNMLISLNFDTYDVLPVAEQANLVWDWLFHLTEYRTRHSPALTVIASMNCSLQLLVPTTRARFVFLMSLSTVLWKRQRDKSIASGVVTGSGNLKPCLEVLGFYKE